MRVARFIACTLWLVAIGIVAGGVALQAYQVRLPGAPAALTFVDAPASPQTLAATGPAAGTKCPVDKAYENEDTGGMQPDAVAAWLLTVRAGEAAGKTLCLNDGKRSLQQQQAEYDDQVRRYGAQWAADHVLTPEQSMHVKGLAVDVQPLTSARWLEETRGALGWCRRYGNEAWHFEYDAKYKRMGCPVLQAQPGA
ncbi:peptidase M15 [Pseudonocardiaceae bacterium YIM PH 21723]|nr:peptidase M15 [Pseudonocardiaceae bacterium YIM PH 21723]